MKFKTSRACVFAIVFALLVVAPPSIPDNPGMSHTPSRGNEQSILDRAYEAEAEGSGSNSASVMGLERYFTGLDFSILNTYANTSEHLEILDLTNYQISGWTLYWVEINEDSMVAAPEREIVGSSSSPSSTGLRIYEHDTDAHFYYDQLAQGFYNKSHDGQLSNFSLLYRTPTYDPAEHNYAYVDLRSNYTNSSTNLIASQQLTYVGSSATWSTVTTSVDLSADATFWVVINGSLLIPDSSFGIYPDIQWYYESTQGEFGTWRHNTNGPTWGGERPFEALLNYTYTPWNETSNSALEFEEPEDINIEGNSTAVAGNTWNFSSNLNISSIVFESNQSVNVNYNLTLRYKKNIESATSWHVGASGSSINWNVSSLLSYPSENNIVDRSLNFSIPADWTPSGLYNSTHASTNHTAMSKDGNSVVCSKLYDETWTLMSAAPNYISEMAIFDSSDDSAVTYTVNVGTILDVNTTVQSPTLIPATTGSVNLTVIHSSLTVYAPSNTSISSGKGHHTWDTGTDHDENGIHTVAVYWSNGTEAGYRTHDVVIVYPTEMTSVSSIDAFTNSTFPFSVFFRDSYTPQPLDGALAAVTYSFDGGSNTNMTDHPNGTWSDIVNTTGKSPGTYDLIVYGEGFAFENVSRVIKVTLIHDTQGLDVSWSNGPDITYVENSELIVVYRRTNDNNVTDAQVNATIGLKTWNLTWHFPSETYRIRFNGTDDPPGFGVHPITINAWRNGYEPQTNDSETLTIDLEGTSLEVSWSNTNNITYLDYTILSVKYLMNDTTEIQGAYLNVTDGTSTWDLIWNNDTKAYEIQFNGTDVATGLNTHFLTIEASLYGYYSASDSTQNLTIREELTMIVLYWSTPHFNNITYIQQTTLYANFTLLDKTPVEFGFVNVTFGIKNWNLTWNAGLERYQIAFNGTDNPPEFGNHSLSVQAWKHGFQYKSNSTQLVIRRDPTTIASDWSDGFTITYVNQTTLIVNYKNSDGIDILGATVNVTIESKTWNMTWNNLEGAYTLTFNGTDSPFLGTHDLNISCWKYGFDEAIDTSQTLIVEEESTYITYSWLSESNITYFEYTYFFVYYRMSNSSIIPGANLNVTIRFDHWNLLWNSTQKAYGIRFNGSNAIPGLGSHTLNVSASAYGYVSAINWSESLIITVEGTNLLVSWSAPTFDSITYLQSTELQVIYEMKKNGTSVLFATVNVTIGTKTWNLTWKGTYYGIWFNGTDIEPGFGSHNLTIKAWKAQFQNHTDSGKTLSIDFEPTLISSYVDETFITYVENTHLVVSYTLLADSTAIEGATVNVTIVDETWNLWWNEADGTYRIRFNGSDNPPGLSTHTLIISAWKYGHENLTDSSTLAISPEQTSIVISWSPSDSITYLQSTVMHVDYRMSNYTSVPDANVVVLIGGNPLPWPVVWNESSGFHEIMFNGTNPIPGLGTFGITVQASKTGYASNSNGTEFLTINPEPTKITLTWESTNQNEITFLQNTTLYANYALLNGSAIAGAIVNVTILGQPWNLTWSPGLQVYQIQFNGTDDPPGLKLHSLTVSAWRHGYEGALNNSQTLNITSEPSDATVYWENTYSNDITYLESTTFYVNYTLPNGTAIVGAIVNVTILGQPWNLTWSPGLQVYQIQFNGTDDPPEFGTHTLNVSAWKHGYIEQTPSDSLVIRPEPTTVTPNWIYDEFEYDKTLTLIFEYRDSHGTLIAGATQKEVWVNSTAETLLGTTGAYRIVLDNRFDLRFHTVAVNISKYGYAHAYNNTVSFTILNASTYITVDWSTLSVDYLGQFNLTLFYGLQFPIMFPWVPTGGVTANVTINGITTLPLNMTGNGYYTANLTGAFLGLGVHNMLIEVWSYGYVFQENLTILTVDLVPTSLDYEWSPANITIDYTMYLNLTLNYTYYGGDIPDSAEVNVTINARTFVLTYVGESWEVSILGSDVNTGVYNATIRASYSFFASQTITTIGINITPAANDFHVEWTPFDRNISYAESVSIAVLYTGSDSEPILGANVTLTINGSEFQTLVYSPTDKKWLISFDATVLGLGLWNFTIRANKTGFESGAEWYHVLVEEDIPILTPSWTLAEIDYLSSVILQLDVDSSNGSAIDDATFEVTLLNITTSPINIGLGIYNTSFGPYLDLGVHSINITFVRFGYQTTSIFLTLNVTAADAALTLDYTSLTIFYDEFVNLNASYLMTNMSYIPGTLFQLTVNASLHTIIRVGNHWEANFSGAALGLGASLCSVTVDAYGFKSLNESFTIIVQVIPTLMTIGPSGSTYVNGTYTFIVTYEDNRTLTYIDADIISIDWPGTYGINQVGVGQYEVNFYADLHNGTYFFLLNLVKTGHLGTSTNQSIDILPIPVEIVYESSIEEYESELLIIIVYLNDTIYSRPVHWANVELTFSGSDFAMIYNHSITSYKVQIQLDTILPGDYTLYIRSTAIDCETSLGIISLTILPKDTYTLTLSTSPEEIEVGDTLYLTATLMNDGSPVPGAEVYFMFTLFLDEVGSQELTLTGTTNGAGIATAEFVVPEGTTSIEINAEFHGSRSAWAAASGPSSIVIRQPGTTPIGILAFLSDPMFQLILGVAVVALVGVGYSRSRRKPKTPIDSSSILLGIGGLTGVRHCIIYNVEKRSHILAESYMATGQDSYVIRALEDIASEGLRGNDIPGFTFEMSLHGLKVFIYRGKMMAGVLTAYAAEKVQYIENLQLLVDTFEEQYWMELPDWPKNTSVYGDIWRIIGPDANDNERIKALVFSREKGAIRAEIANQLNMSVKKVSTIVKKILDTDPDFQDVRVGRKKLVRFRSALSDEIS